MTWILIYVRMLSPVDPAVEVLAVFEDPKHCQIMMSELAKLETNKNGYTCLGVRHGYKIGNTI